MFAWLWCGERLHSGAGLPRFGETINCKPPVRLHHSGLHAALDPYDALVVNASGSMLAFVRAEGVLQSGDGWVASTHQRFCNVVDAGPLLTSFSRWCALQAEPVWQAPAVARDFLLTGDATLAEPARLECAALVRQMPRADAGRGIARLICQIAMGFSPHVLAQAAMFQASYALAGAAGDGSHWVAARDKADGEQRIELNREIGVLLSLDLQKGVQS